MMADERYQKMLIKAQSEWTKVPAVLDKVFEAVQGFLYPNEGGDDGAAAGAALCSRRPWTGRATAMASVTARARPRVPTRDGRAPRLASDASLAVTSAAGRRRPRRAYPPSQFVFLQFVLLGVQIGFVSPEVKLWTNHLWTKQHAD